VSPSADQLSSQAARGTVWLGLVNVLSKGSQIVVTIALGHFLSRSQVGAVTIAVVLVNLGQTLQSMGVYDVVTRTRHDPLKFAGSVATLSLLTASVATLVLVAFGGVIADAIGAPNAGGPLRVAALGLPFTAYFGVQMGFLHRRLDFRRRMVPDAGSALAGAAVTVVAAATGAGVWSLVAGILVTAVLGPLLGLAVDVRPRPRVDREHLAEALSWVRVVGPAAVLGILLLNVDYLVVSRVLGEEANGLYSYAYRFAFVPFIMIAVVIGGVAFPVYTRIIHADGGQAGAAIGPAFTRFVHALVASTGGLYLLLALLAPRIVVIDQRWAPSVPVLRVLCLYGFVLGLVQAGYDALRASGRPGLYLRGQAVHLVLLVVLAVVLVHREGIVGVAWAQVIAVGVVAALVAVLLVRQRIAQPGLARAVAGPAIAAVTTLALYVTLRSVGALPPDASAVGLVWLGLALCGCYAALLGIADARVLRNLIALVGRRQGSPP
jgi:O-antigen/teichoic acid export membrane protein